MKIIITLTFSLLSFVCAAEISNIITVGQCNIEIDGFEMRDKQNYKQFVKYEGYKRKAVLLTLTEPGQFLQEFLEINYLIKGELKSENVSLTLVGMDDTRYDYKYIATIVNFGKAELVLDGFGREEVIDALEHCLDAEDLELLFDSIDEK